MVMIGSAGACTSSAMLDDDLLARLSAVPGIDLRLLPRRWGGNLESRHAVAAARGLGAVAVVTIGVAAPMIEHGVAPTGAVPTRLSSFGLTVDGARGGS
jgi:hypothetical protein